MVWRIDWGVLRVLGADRVAFLDGQFTQKVSVDQPCHGAFCTPGGRVTATAHIVPSGDTLLILSHPDRVETLRTRLARYVLRAKVTLEAVDSQPVFCRRDGDSSPALALTVAHTEPAEPLSAAAFSELRIRAGWPAITQAVEDAFIPQAINLDLLAGISFSKGCYTGQEIVARTQHLGSVKRRMLSLHMHGSDAPAAGTRVVDEHGRSQGQIVEASSAAGTIRLLASVRVAVAHQPLFCEGLPESPLEAAQLPYTVPELANP